MSWPRQTGVCSLFFLSSWDPYWQQGWNSHERELVGLQGLVCVCHAYLMAKCSSQTTLQTNSGRTRARGFPAVTWLLRGHFILWPWASNLLSGPQSLIPGWVDGWTRGATVELLGTLDFVIMGRIKASIFSLHPHLDEGVRGLCGVSFIRSLIPSWGLHPRGFITSQRLHLLTPSS